MPLSDSGSGLTSEFPWTLDYELGGGLSFMLLGVEVDVERLDWLNLLFMCLSNLAMSASVFGFTNVSFPRCLVG